MAIIQYCSDLHLEFPENKAFLEQHPIQPVGDILVLAGDIVPFVVMDKNQSFFDEISEKFKQVFWIPGNHEYYHFDIQKRTGTFCEEIRDNVFLVNNYVTQTGQIKLIFSTLWTDISENNQWQILQHLSDFHVIKHGNGIFRPSYYNTLHRESLEFIKKTVNSTDDSESMVVVTHHVPTFMNYPKKYLENDLNEAFAVELSDFIKSSTIDHWIFGHHHSRVPPFNIGKTQLLTNQLGYVKYGEHTGFSHTSTITL